MLEQDNITTMGQTAISIGNGRPETPPSGNTKIPGGKTLDQVRQEYGKPQLKAPANIPTIRQSLTQKRPK